jgi:hypothetical protein
MGHPCLLSVAVRFAKWCVGTVMAAREHITFRGSVGGVALWR